MDIFSVEVVKVGNPFSSRQEKMPVSYLDDVQNFCWLFENETLKIKWDNWKVEANQRIEICNNTFSK